MLPAIWKPSTINKIICYMSVTIIILIICIICIIYNTTAQEIKEPSIINSTLNTMKNITDDMVKISENIKHIQNNLYIIQDDINKLINTIK